MVKLRAKQICGFSLLESMIAMTIILLVFVVCIKVFVEFNSKYLIHQKQEIVALIDRDLASQRFLEVNKVFKTENKQLDLYRTIHQVDQNLVLIEYRAEKLGRLIYQREEYRYVSKK